MSFEGCEVVHVVAMDGERCIGTKNTLPWHLPGDLQHFKAITQHGVIVMGRHTFESIGRPLPNRKNLVLTSHPEWSAPGVEIACTIEDILKRAVFEARARNQHSIYIIGGGKVFRQTLDIADRLEVTHVHMQVRGDTYYPIIPATFHAGEAQVQVDEVTQIHYDFVQYQRLNSN